MPASAPLSAACAWLDSWRAVGSVAYLVPDGMIQVWWIPGPDTMPRSRALLDQLDADDSLRTGVKVLLQAEAITRQVLQ